MADFPAAKKQKTTPQPIVFVTPGAKPDVRFFVFEQEYHVSSGALKLYSVFFRQFLEPAAGVMPKSSSPFFKSDWYTQIDSGLPSGWCLSSDEKLRNADLSEYPAQPQYQNQCFRKLLCSIFGCEFHIEDIEELRLIVELAEYYCAIPKLSSALDGALFISPELQIDLAHYPCHMMHLALRLRHKKLYNDSFILALGPWSKPTFRVECDFSFRSKHKQAEQVFQLLSAEHTRFKAQLTEVHFQLLRRAGEECEHCPQKRSPGLNISKLTRESLVLTQDGKKFSLPQFFRNCLKELRLAPGGRLDLLTHALSSMVEENNLIIYNPYAAGKCKFAFPEDYFLSFRAVSVPWDESQTDW